MNHLNITLNLVISVNHYPSKKKPGNDESEKLHNNKNAGC